MRIPIRPPELADDPRRPMLPRAPSLGTGSRIWLVRHAEVHDDWQDCAYGNMDVPLSEAGVRITRELSAAFALRPLARVVSSQLSRALALGRGLAQATGAPLAIDDRLREVWRGDWQGLRREDFRTRWEAQREAFAADPWTWKGHGGESDVDIFARAWPALEEAARSSPPGAEIALATHYNVIRVLVTRALGLRASESFAFRNDCARVSLLVDRPGGWQLVCANVDRPECGATSSL